MAEVSTSSKVATRALHSRSEMATRVRGPVSSALFTMMPLYKMLNIYFWRGFFGPFFCFVFPVMITALMIAAFDKDQIPGVISMAVSGVGINGLSQTIIDFKKSVLLKRIGATPIKPWMFIFAITSYMFVVSVIVTFWTLLWVVICQTQTFAGIFAGLEWGSFLFSTMYTIILSCILGMLVVSLAKTSNMVQIVGVMITMPQYFLSGQFLPLNHLSPYPGLNGLSHVIPFRYNTAMYFQSWHESIFSGFGTDYRETVIDEGVSNPNQLIFYDYDRILNFVMPAVFTVIFGGVCIRFFKWSTR